MRSPGGGELSLTACPGVGNRPPSKKKIANPRGCARGGMVTGRIEPCVKSNKATRRKQQGQIYAAMTQTEHAQSGHSLSQWKISQLTTIIDNLIINGIFM